MGFAKFDGIVTTVVFRLFLFNDVSFNGYAEMVGLNKVNAKMLTNLKKMRDGRNQILEAPNMTGEEKRRMLRQLDTSMIDYSSTILKAMREMGVHPEDPSNPVTTLMRRLVSGGGTSN